MPTMGRMKISDPSRNAVHAAKRFYKLYGDIFRELGQRFMAQGGPA